MNKHQECCNSVWETYIKIMYLKNLTDKQEVPKTNEYNIEMILSKGRQ